MDDGEVCRDLPRWDRWFELHPLDYVESLCPGYCAWMNKQNKPVYLTAKDVRVKLGQEFPLDDICKHLGPFSYFTNSASFMVAMAIHWDVKEIGVYGLDMATRAEYGWQRPSVEYWLGMAAGRGIKIHIPQETDLLKCGRLYGFDQTDMTAKVAARKIELENRLTNAKAEAEQFNNLYMMAAGACKEIETIKRECNGQAPPGLDDRAKMLGEQMEHCLNVARQADKDQIRIQGAQEDLEWCEQWA